MRNLDVHSLSWRAGNEGRGRGVLKGVFGRPEYENAEKKRKKKEKGGLSQKKRVEGTYY